MNTWDAVVDVSNVCWSPQLPPVGRRTPLWHRLDLVRDAWRDLHGSGTRFTLVADESLVRALDVTAEYRRLRDDGALFTRPIADALILELARDHGLHVLSRDHYIDYRPQHPWIENAPERFHSWAMADDRVQIVPLGIVHASAQTISRALEVKDLQRTKLHSNDPQHRKILGTRWKCANTLCVQAAQWQDQLLVWPLVTSEGGVLCPSCSLPLLALGPRDPLYEAVVEHRTSGAEIMRFPLEVNSPVVVGRGSTLKGVNLAMDQASFRSALMRVSRQHLLVWIEDLNGMTRRMVVIDLDSRNGTAVERWTGAGFDPLKPLAPNRDTIIGSKDRLLLGGAVNLRLSGKHYVTYPGGSEPTALSITDWSSAENSATVSG
jgi:FHA domain